MKMEAEGEEEEEEALGSVAIPFHETIHRLTIF